MNINDLVSLLGHRSGIVLGQHVTVTHNPVGNHFDLRSGTHFMRLDELTYQGNLQKAATEVEAWVRQFPNQGAQSHGLSGQAAQAGTGSSGNSFIGSSIYGLCPACGRPSGGGRICGLCSAYQATGLQNQLGAIPNAYAQQAIQAQLSAMQAQQSQYQGLGGSVYANVPEPVKNEPLKISEFKVGEIEGYRGWRVTEDGFLRSMSARVIWAPGEPMEGKTKSREEHNGVYAYKRASDFLSNHENAGLNIYGKVHMWGDVIEHELGYRAEFAKIVSLDHFLGPAPFKLNIRDLREKYQVAA